MLRSTACVLLILACGSATAAPPPGYPRESAPQWQWALHDENDKEVAKGHLIVRGFAIYNSDGKKIGSYEDVGKDKDHVKMDISEGKLKGEFDLYKDKGSLDTWKGEIDNETGGKYKVTVRFSRL